MQIFKALLILGGVFSCLPTGWAGTSIHINVGCVERVVAKVKKRPTNMVVHEKVQNTLGEIFDHLDETPMASLPGWPTAATYRSLDTRLSILRKPQNVEAAREFLKSADGDDWFETYSDLIAKLQVDMKCWTAAGVPSEKAMIIYNSLRAVGDRWWFDEISVNRGLRTLAGPLPLRDRWPYIIDQKAEAYRNY